MHRRNSDSTVAAGRMPHKNTQMTIWEEHRNEQFEAHLVIFMKETRKEMRSGLAEHIRKNAVRLAKDALAHRECGEIPPK